MWAVCTKILYMDSENVKSGLRVIKVVLAFSNAGEYTWGEGDGWIVWNNFSEIATPVNSISCNLDVIILICKDSKYWGTLYEGVSSRKCSTGIV